MAEKRRITEKELLDHVRAAAEREGALLPNEDGIRIVAKALAAYLGVEVVAGPELPDDVVVQVDLNGRWGYVERANKCLSRSEARAVVTWWAQRGEVEKAIEEAGPGNAATRLRKALGAVLRAAWGDEA